MSIKDAIFSSSKKLVSRGAGPGRSTEKPEASAYGSLQTFGLGPNLELLILL